MTDTYYYAADAKKSRRLHDRGHPRLGDAFTACGHPLGAEVKDPPRGMLKHLRCGTCENQARQGRALAAAADWQAGDPITAAQVERRQHTPTPVEVRLLQLETFVQVLYRLHSCPQRNCPICQAFKDWERRR